MLNLSMNLHGIIAHRLVFFLFFVLASCTTAPQIIDTVSSPVTDIQSAVINLNIMNRSATIQPLAPESDLLFSALVGDVNTVTYSEVMSEQAFIMLSDNPNVPSSNDWSIQATTAIPLAYVVDVTDGTLNADLSLADLPRFDIVASNSTLDIDLPMSGFQLAVDASDSTSNFNIPTGAVIQSSQLVSNGGLMTMTVAEGVSFAGTVASRSGGFTLNVPVTTGVQIIVSNSQNSEISLPNAPRVPAEAISYSTDNFFQTDSQIILQADLNGSAMRIIQE
ncbi:MAG: hypothetical protein Phog2KO_31970 [Phototrophicaceae bacterium]